MPFHAFITVWTSTLVGHFTLLRLWDEVTLSALMIVTAYLLFKDRMLRDFAYKNTLFRLITGYIALVIVLGIIALAGHNVSPKALGYGLIIDLRYLIWFVCVWLVSKKFNWLQTNWKRIVFWPLAAVVVFGILQFFVLPNNFLMHFGYGKDTFTPYITINQDTATMRIQSFLRGPNPLGIYLAAMIGLLASLINFSKKSKYLWLLVAGASLALYLSFSRSGLMAAFIAVILAVGLRLKTKKQQRIAASIVITAIVLLALGFGLTRNSSSVQDVVLHVNSSHSTTKQTSNLGHLSTFKQSLTTIAHQPFGRGPGTAGQASWYNNGHDTRNTESYLAQIGEEFGWLGLGLFLLILFKTAEQLWLRRSQPLAIGLLASLVGLTFVSLFSYTFSDDTLAFVWWGLAGLLAAE